MLYGDLSRFHAGAVLPGASEREKSSDEYPICEGSALYGTAASGEAGSYFNFHFIFGELSESIDPYDFEAAEKSKETLYIIMTDAFTGQPVYVSSRSCTVKEFFKISEASCSIPLFSKPVPLKDGIYVDGGIGMPLCRCLRSFLCAAESQCTS